MKSLQHQHVMILGLGISGLAMARWCVRFDANVLVVDTRANPPQLEQLKAELPSVKFICSAFVPHLVGASDLAFLLVSPGIKPVETAELVTRAKEINVRIGNELTLFNMAMFELNETQQYRPQVLAIDRKSVV